MYQHRHSSSTKIYQFFNNIIVIITLLLITIIINSVNGIPSELTSLSSPAQTTTTTTNNNNIQANLAAIFNTQQNLNNNNNYYDDYVPYRSDIHDEFSLELFKQVLKEENNRNVIFSPFSVKLVLALLSEAAGNNTQTQIELQRTLTEIKLPDNLRSFYKKTLTSLNRENPDYVFNLETKLYVDNFIEPQQRYTAMLHAFYNTDIERLNFANPSNAAQIINSWSESVTNGRLKNLVDESNVQNNVLLLANILYFNGKWKREFNESYEGAFFRTATDQIKVDYMEQTEYFYYHNSDQLDAKIIRLPYQGRKFAMFILLPKTKMGLEKLTNLLQNDQLKSMQWQMKETKLKITLPKFKFDYTKNLKETLQSLNINDIFTDQASLPGLARGANVAGKLKVSNIYQKAGIEVNERGTEAYAATVVEIDTKFSGQAAIEEFTVNRPFLFFIEEISTGIVFAGKVVDPRNNLSRNYY